ncbi:MAG: flagellar hook-basal body complex protein FliE [Geminicoccaceae bacterium]
MSIAHINQALSAYGAAQRRLRLDAEPAAATGVGTPAAAAPQFASLLRDELQGTADKLKAGEDQAVQALSGKASLQQVVEAVTEAELSLQKMTAIRDRVISAYQEIMRMPI